MCNPVTKKELQLAIQYLFRYILKHVFRSPFVLESYLILTFPYLDYLLERFNIYENNRH